MQKIILPLLIGAAALFYVGKNQITKSATSVKFILKQVRLTGTNIIIKLGVLNASGQAATIRSIVGELTLNGKTLATVKNFSATTIKPAAETDLELTLVPSGVGLVSLLADLAGGKKVKGFLFTGQANVNNILFPISIKP